MKSVALIVTGDAERVLGKALMRIFPDVSFRSPVKLDGFTSSKLPPGPLPGDLRQCVEKIAAQRRAPSHLAG